MTRLIDPFEQFFNSKGKPLVKGELNFFESGSSTVRKTTFADSAETIPNSNPVIMGGDGRSPNIFGSGSYRAILTDSDQVQIISRDPVGGDLASPFGADWSSSVTYSTSDVVRDDGDYWESLTNNNLNNRPSTDNGLNWERSIVSLGDVVDISGRIVNSVADAKIDLSLSVGQSVRTLGYTVAGGVGAAPYIVVDPAQFSGTPDEQGDHTLDNGQILVLQTGNVKDISQYGAALDGVADDTAAMTAAIAKLTDGDTLLIPKGIAGLSSADGQVRPPTGLPSGSTPVKFTIDGLSNITITGGGRITLLGGNNYNLFNITNCTGFTIDNIQVQGNREPVLADINYDGEIGEFFRFFDCTDIKIQNNYMTLQSITCIRIGSNCHRVVIADNVNYDGNDAFVQVGDASVTTQENVPSDVTITGNVIDQYYTDAGIKIRYCADRVTISGNNNVIAGYLYIAAPCAVIQLVHVSGNGVVKTADSIPK